MSNMIRATASILLIGAAVPAAAQQPQPQRYGALTPAGVTVTNNAPNPYETVVGWAKMPEGRTWGSTSGVGIDKDGVSVWALDRCGANSCVGSSLDPILLFDKSGNFVRSFGSGLVQVPHGLWVDRDGNIWVTDWSNNGGAQNGARRDSTKGHQVMKFSPDGTLLLTLGRAGGGRDTAYFWQPNAVVTARNGDIFVAEGHSNAPTANARIFKFDKHGTLLRTYGKRGDSGAVDELMQPHALAIDTHGRLFVADRSNNRILILDQDFKHLETWHQFSRPSGIWIDDRDRIYVADAESGSVEPRRPEWKRGLRIGSARDGSVTAFIPDPDSTSTNTSSAEGVAVDKNGVIYGAEVGQRALKRYVRKP